MADDTAQPNPTAALVGACFTADATAVMLRCTPEELQAKFDTGDALGVRTSDGVWLCPAFQFTTNGAVRPELTPLLHILSAHPSWDVAVWLRTGHPELDGYAPERWLKAHRDPEVVHALAQSANLNGR